jgi:hypothetical protein
MMSAATALIPFLTLAAAPAATSEVKLERPRFALRATPRVAFSPVMVFLTAELQGGHEIEEYYCPELEWDWDDGSRSAHGADCPPFAAGTALERRFTAEHAFRSAGTYTVKVTMRRASRVLAVASATVNVRPGAGDFTE